MSAVVIDGGLIHYEAFGRGNPVIFLHGWLGSWRYWVPAMEEISERYRTYALDLWGFGDSDKSRASYDLTEYVRLLESFMDRLGIVRAPLVGHSLGAAIAVRFAVQHGQRVERLMAVSLPLTAQAINPTLLSTGNVSLLKRLRWRRHINHEEVITEMPKAAEEAIRQSVRSFRDLNLWKDIYRLPMPILVIYGGKDNIVDPSQALRFPDSEVHVKSIVLARARHFPMLDEARVFNRLLKEFLRAGDDLRGLRVKEEWRRRTR